MARQRVARMTKLALWITAALALAIAIPGAMAQPVVRTEVHPIASLTQTTQQFLRSGMQGTPVTLAGELRIPKAGTDRLPAVILVHGSGGIGANIDGWAHTLNAMGVAVFILDSFSGRGITSTVADQTQLDALAMMTDAYRALALLQKHPRIDPARIAVMGFSKGAVAAVYSSAVRFRRLYVPLGPGFAAHIGLYTPCNMQLRDDDKVGAPIRLFHGAPDDWVPATPCRDYVARLKKAGADVSLTEYPGAWHAYDNPATPVPVINAAAQTSRGCRMREDVDGQMLNIATGKAFAYTDACVEHGAHIGYNQAAYDATLIAVKDFLKQVFRLQALPTVP
jgi:dienelactone hydrolase